jgi:hypothetical protein
MIQRRWFASQLACGLMLFVTAASAQPAHAAGACYQFTIAPADGSSADTIVVTLSTPDLPAPNVDEASMNLSNEPNSTYHFSHYNLLDSPGASVSVAHGATTYTGTLTKAEIDGYTSVRPAPHLTDSGLKLSLVMDQAGLAGSVSGAIVLTGAPPAAFDDGKLPATLPTLDMYTDNHARIWGTDASWAPDGKVTSINTDCAISSPVPMHSSPTPVVAPQVVLLTSQTTKSINLARGGMLSTPDGLVTLAVPADPQSGETLRIRLSILPPGTQHANGGILIGRLPIVIAASDSAGTRATALSEAFDLVVRPLDVDVLAAGGDAAALTVSQVDSGSNTLMSLPFSVDGAGNVHVSITELPDAR